MRPDDLKYTETHEWLKINKKTKTVTLGITDYAVSQLSDLVHIELPESGDSIEAGQPFGEIESVKAVSDLFAPVSGEVTEVNDEVLDNLDLLAKDPFEDGWLVKVQATEMADMDELMTRKEYDEFVLSEASGDDDEEEEETAKKKAKADEDKEEAKVKGKAKDEDEDEDDEDDDDDDDDDEDDDDDD